MDSARETSNRPLGSSVEYKNGSLLGDFCPSQFSGGWGGRLRFKETPVSFFSLKEHGYEK